MGGVAKLFLGWSLSCFCVLGAGAGDLESLKHDYVRPAEIPFPADNPYTPQKAELGRVMFFDPMFSASKTISCATCHLPGMAWTDAQPHARGEGKSAMSLRTPTLVNVAWLDKLGWDGKFPDIESVAFTPITGKLNMNLAEPTLVERLSAAPAYASLFDRAFGDATVTRKRVELALATFERTIVSSNSPFDHWLAGDEAAISDAAKHGFELFNGKAKCAECHSGWAFTDGSFHDIGTASDNDIGRGRYFPTSTKLRYAFKTPSLRDVALRPPYMHTGAIATLAQVIDFYNDGGIDRPSRSEVIRPLALANVEKAELLAFLRTLTGSAAGGTPDAARPAE